MKDYAAEFEREHAKAQQKAEAERRLALWGDEQIPLEGPFLDKLRSDINESLEGTGYCVNHSLELVLR